MRPKASRLFDADDAGTLFAWDAGGMIDLSRIAEFLFVGALVIVTPGQDTALTIRNTVAGRRIAGIATACGVIAGQLTWALATSAGAAAVLAASETAFSILRLVGAVYLVYLGAQSIRAALTRGSFRAADSHSSVTPMRAFRQGLLSNLSNPKMVAFFPSLLPQFVAPERATFLALFVLGAIFAAMTLVWLVAYALVVDRIGAVLRRDAPRRVLDAITGTVLVGFGVRLFATR